MSEAQESLEFLSGIAIKLGLGACRWHGTIVPNTSRNVQVLNLKKKFSASEEFTRSRVTVIS
jgi:hypothetical protein